MKVHNVKILPKSFSDYYDLTELGEEYDIPVFVTATGADVAIYWYAYGGCAGVGQILFRVNGIWYMHDCGHCSCYGPTDRIGNLGEGYKTLDDVLKNCSDDLKIEVEPLIKFAKSRRYK